MPEANCDAKPVPLGWPTAQTSGSRTRCQRESERKFQNQIECGRVQRVIVSSTISLNKTGSLRLAARRGGGDQPPHSRNFSAGQSQSRLQGEVSREKHEHPSIYCEAATVFGRPDKIPCMSLSRLPERVLFKGFLHQLRRNSCRADADLGRHFALLLKNGTTLACFCSNMYHFFFSLPASA